MELRLTGSTILGVLLILVSNKCSLEVNAGAAFATTSPFHAQKYADISTPRGLLLDDNGDILVVAKGTNNIIALYETTSGGTITVQQVAIIDGVGLELNHGIAYLSGYLYASSATNVYRWPYLPGQRTMVKTAPETVIFNIPNGIHITRTLIFDRQSRLYVSVGSFSNVDLNSDRARIRRFDLSKPLPVGGINFSSGEVFADGLRNEVGLDFDLNGNLWGVENGADELVRTDLGGDIHNGNPAEEMNKFNGTIGAHYGYPYCFSTYKYNDEPAGTQYAWPTFLNDGVHSDAWCRNPANNRPPALAMPAHQAPLGIQFYKGEGCDKISGAFPCSYTGDAFVAFRGSWNSDIPTGYRVSRIPMDSTSILPTGEYVDVIFQPNVTTSCLGDKSRDCFRPVNAIFDKGGHLIVSADATGEIFRVYYGSPPPTLGSANNIQLTFTLVSLMALALSVSLL